MASAVAVQLLKGSIPHFELNGTRFVCSVFLLTLGLLLKKKLPAILTSHIVITVCLGITILADTACLYIAVIYIPVSSAQSILISTEIISGIFLFAIFVKEKITIKGIVFAALCVVGVFLVIQPDFIFHRKNQLQKTNDLQNLTAADQQLTDNGFTYHTEIIGYALCILSGLSFIVNILLFKEYPYLTDNIMSVLFWCFLFCAIVSIGATATFETPDLPRDIYSLTLVGIHSLTFVFLFPLTMYDAKYISGSTINIIFSLTVVTFLISQYTVLSSMLHGHKNWIEVTGVILVLLGSTMESILEVSGFE